jgi:hypothetical protein
LPPTGRFRRRRLRGPKRNSAPKGGIRTRGARIAALLLVLAAAGCGATPQEEEQPALPAELAEALAARADGVAERLAAGDQCAAAAEADELVHETRAAVEARRVPVQLEAELLTGAQELAARIECPPDADEPPAAQEEPPAEPEAPPEEPAVPEAVQTLALGDAGTIEFRLLGDGETLELVGVLPASGWRHSVSADEDEIDVDLSRGNREISVAIDADGGGRLTFDIDYEAGRGNGTHVIGLGPAGEVAVTVQNGTLSLLRADLGPGWTATVDEDDDTIEVEGRHEDGSELSLVIEVA